MKAQHAALFLCAILAISSLSFACEDHHDRRDANGYGYPKRSPSQIANDFRRDYRCEPTFYPDSTDFHFYCPSTVVNGISVACREHWMKAALQIQYDNAAPQYSLCPTSMFAAIAVNHSDASAGNFHDANGQNCGASVAQSSGQSGSKSDPTNHAENQVLRIIATMYPNRGRDRSLWGQLSIYGTGEPCGMCSNAQIFAGVKEAIWATSVQQMLEMGDGQRAIASSVDYRNAVQFSPFNPTVAIGFVESALLAPLFNYTLGSGPCPTGCARDPATRKCTVTGFF